MRYVLALLMVSGFSVTGFADYTYTITEYQQLPLLYDTQSMLITGQGGGGYTALFGKSSLTIESTSPLSQGSGGIWEIDLIGDNSRLEQLGGQVHTIDIGNNATAFLSGGLIQQIWSSQNAWIYAGDPPSFVPNPHITIKCLDHFYDTNTKLLTGHWLDNTAFSIHLIDVQGYSPAIENIQFIPEPATLSLLGIGAFLAGRRRK